MTIRAYAVLACLGAHGTPMTCGAIVHWLWVRDVVPPGANRSGSFNLHMRSLFHAGWITKTELPNYKLGRTRWQWSLTDAGRSELLRWVQIFGSVRA